MVRAVSLALISWLGWQGISLPSQNLPRAKSSRRSQEGRSGRLLDLQRSNQGLRRGEKTGKPMIVILRCIPCVECVKLDDDLVNQDPRVRTLLEKFVCVRIVSTNGLDLSLFQYDYDQSFATFFLNADGSIYGRFGTRSHRTSWADDVSINGLARR